MGLVTTFFALYANLRVERVWKKLQEAGEILQTTAVTEFPPNDYESNRVNFESR